MVGMTSDHPVFKRPYQIVEISGIGEGTEKGIDVTITSTGLVAWLPRKEVDFLPGHVVMPVYLYNEIFGECGA